MIGFTPAAGWYLVLLGVGLGLAALAMTGYSWVSPRWLRLTLLVAGLLVSARYLVMAHLSLSPVGQALGPLDRLWLGSSIGLTWPGVVAIDQLIRHPAMTPERLLKSFSPFLLVYTLVMVAGPMDLRADPLIGVSPHLLGWARILLIVTQSAFVALLMWFTMQVMRKVPASRTRTAVFGLMGGYLALAVDGVIRSTGLWYVRPFLFSEFLLLLALWFAFDTARHHPL